MSLSQLGQFTVLLVVGLGSYGLVTGLLATIPLWLALLALMGIGPLLPWRRAEHQSLLKNLGWLMGKVTAGAAA